MKLSSKSSGIIYVISCCVLMLLAPVKGEEDLLQSIVKYKSEWGKECIQCQNSTKSYRVYFRNTGSKKLDVKCAVQENDKRWRTFTHLNLALNDTFVAYACSGTGKYMLWPREAGDKMVDFPTDEEINNQFSR